MYRPFKTGRRLLLAGFGGLLLLMLVSGGDALLVLQGLAPSDAQLRDVYLKRSRALDDVRTGIYQSAIVMRDYLLATNNDVADEDISKWTAIRKHTDAALARCGASLDPEEAGPFRSLEAEVQLYWKWLDFVSEIQGGDKRIQGSAYLSGELNKRRNAMLSLVDRIDQLSTREMNAGDAKLNATRSIALRFASDHLMLGNHARRGPPARRLHHSPYAESQKTN